MDEDRGEEADEQGDEDGRDGGREGPCQPVVLRVVGERHGCASVKRRSAHVTTTTSYVVMGRQMACEVHVVIDIEHSGRNGRLGTDLGVRTAQREVQVTCGTVT